MKIWEITAGRYSELTNNTAGIANAVMVFINFVLTLPALATPARGLLKTAGYMIAVNAVFSLIIGLDLWITTLKTKQEFFEIWVSQPPEVQSLMQTRVCSLYFWTIPKAHRTDYESSSNAVVISTAPRLLSSPTPPARALPPPS